MVVNASSIVQHLIQMKNGTMINVNVGARIISDPEKVTVVFVRYMKSIDDDSVVVKKQSKRLYF